MSVTSLRRWWTDDGTEASRLYMWCPGCDDVHFIQVSGPEPLWQWDGNREAPTISPSIKVGGVQWAEGEHFHKPNHAVPAGQPITCHSFVRAGRWEFLSDCTHGLAGQTVPMTDLADRMFSHEEEI